MQISLTLVLRFPGLGCNVFLHLPLFNQMLRSVLAFQHFRVTAF